MALSSSRRIHPDKIRDRKAAQPIQKRGVKAATRISEHLKGNLKPVPRRGQAHKRRVRP